VLIEVWEGLSIYCFCDYGLMLVYNYKVMSEVQNEGDVIMEPLPINSAQKEGANHSGLKEEYVRILEHLDERVKKPLQSLKAMLEAEIERIRTQE
jgi:hypothetical protein